MSLLVASTKKTKTLSTHESPFLLFSWLGTNQLRRTEYEIKVNVLNILLCLIVVSYWIIHNHTIWIKTSHNSSQPHLMRHSQHFCFSSSHLMTVTGQSLHHVCAAYMLSRSSSLSPVSDPDAFPIGMSQAIFMSSSATPHRNRLRLRKE